MLFNSFTFLHFFAVAYAGFLLLRRSPRLWKPWLLAASYVFYMSWNPPFVLLLIGTSVLDFLIGRQLGIESAPSRRRALLTLSVISNLGVLGLFKYYGFGRDNLNALARLMGMDWSLPPWTFVLPLGISFYTFQSLSYTIDCYRRDVRPCASLQDFLLFVAFFPQLIAGPILRAGRFLPQLTGAPPLRWSAFYHGAGYVLAGLVKKVLIADRLAPYVEQVYADPGQATFATAWLGTYAFAAQIYCDFSGYSDMALGLARMMGFRVPRNFRRPYLALNPREFWRRWHITLSTALRDYLYIPLGGSRCGPVRGAFALMATMLLGGLWHGANWTFVVWGCFHGAWLVLHRIWDTVAGARAFRTALPWRILSLAATFHAVCLGWVWFRAPDAASAMALTRRMAAPAWDAAALPMGVLAVLAGFAALHVGLLDRLAGPRTFRARPLATAAATGLLICLLLVYAAAPQTFIYFAF